MLFGTSGIRGFYGREITPHLAMGIANAFSEMGERIAIASDLRETSEILREAAIAGMLARGADVLELGEVPTPTLAWNTQMRRGKGIMITASHNPEEYNGLKLYRNGREISKAEEKKVEAAYAKGMVLAEWNQAGRRIPYSESAHDHIEMIMKNVDAKKISKAALTVVLDCNGVGSAITPLLLGKMGCRVISLNCAGTGFCRGSEPNAENLVGLGKTVRASGANLGIAHDGDADRMMVVDENGEMLGLDVQFAIAIERELAQKKGTVATTVEASLLIKEVIEKNNGKNYVVGVGSANVSEAMERLGEEAVFGGEPAGEYIYKNGVNTPDGIMAAAKFLEIAAEMGSLAKLGKKYVAYPILREKFTCQNRQEAMAGIANSLKLGGKVNAIDGIRHDFEDGFVLVRASGTESAIRLTAEFRSGKRLDEMAEKAKKEIKKAIQ